MVDIHSAAAALYYTYIRVRKPHKRHKMRYQLDTREESLSNGHDYQTGTPWPESRRIEALGNGVPEIETPRWEPPVVVLSQIESPGVVLEILPPWFEPPAATDPELDPPVVQMSQIESPGALLEIQTPRFDPLAATDPEIEPPGVEAFRIEPYPQFEAAETGSAPMESLGDRRL
jgi:hypothetical protein